MANYEMKFSCKDCVFAEMTAGSGAYVQTGCEIGRLDKLASDTNQVEETEDGTRYTMFDRFCNTYRPKEWLGFADNDDPKTTVMREVSPVVGFVVFFNYEVDEPLAALKKTLWGIKNQEGDHQARYVVVTNSNVAYSQEILNTLKEFFSDSKKGHVPTEYNVVRPIANMESNFNVLDEAFSRAKNGWIYATESTKEVPVDLLEKIHQRINIDMRRLLLVEPRDGQLNGLIFQAALFKLLQGSKLIVDETTMMLNSKNFIERVKGMESNDPDVISTWEEFYGEPAS